MLRVVESRYHHGKPDACLIAPPISIIFFMHGLAKIQESCKSMVSYLQVAAVRLQQVTKRLTHRRRLTLGIVRQRIEGKFIAIVDGLFRQRSAKKPRRCSEEAVPSTAPHPQAAWENCYHQPPKPYLSSGGTALRFPIYIPRHVPRYSIPETASHSVQKSVPDLHDLFYLSFRPVYLLSTVYYNTTSNYK